MKKLVILGLLSIAAASTVFADRVQEITYGDVVGTVVDTDGKPVEGVAVSLKRAPIEGSTTVITEVLSSDAKGAFGRNQIVAGDYTVVARKRPGYEDTAEIKIKIPAHAPVKLALTIRAKQQ